MHDVRYTASSITGVMPKYKSYCSKCAAPQRQTLTTDLRATMASLRTTSTALELPPLDCSLIFPDLIGFQMERNPTFPR
jgi:hypothetical protein